ncbi:hypothetical protein GTU71_12825 [Rathayibacter sp. VKM Ac-2762]|uniref:hypothetical protein n=1 Tax=unclassified Rathayibacter TaxID=2609250 RepID=UPI000CE8D8A7|nr:MULTISPECIES: hypothetical protein [unclassified Rathayibacter]PPF30703.1 hypothetical protein C5C10_15605 [Rathayibacter sp. AY1A3]PPG83286.1 hypothetical protein C5C52_03110 [Rathayibacter sp. AY1E5]QHF21626.1 hypothetical protein GTU71_12825 [Rathayibacter sp. VKM Ac-2762]
MQLLRSARSAGTRLVSTSDVQVTALVAVLIPAAALLASRTLEVDGPYLSSRATLLLVSLGVPLAAAAVAGSRALEHRLGVENAVVLAVPSARARTGGALLAVAVLGFAWGAAAHLIVVGAESALSIGAPVTVLLLQSLRAGLVVAVLVVAARSLGDLLRNTAAVWTLVLAWSAVGERLVGSIPGLGPIAGPFLPVRNADYFVTGSAYGADYPWSAPWALLVPLAWAAALCAAALTVSALVPVLSSRKENH